MQPDFVVDLLNKFLHMLPQLGETGITAGIDLFPLECLYETLALAVFPRTSRPAHTQVRTAGFQPLNVFVAGILCTSIGVMYQTGLWMTAGNGRLQSCQRQLGFQTPPQFPTDRFAREGIQHNRQEYELAL